MTTPGPPRPNLPKGMGYLATSVTPVQTYSPLPEQWSLELPGMGQSSNTIDTLDGCRRLEDAYVDFDPLGEGTYGEVFRAKDKETGELVAIKRFKGDTHGQGFPITALREIKILAKLAACDEKICGNFLRDNIVRLRETVFSDGNQYYNKPHVCMVFDYMDHDMAGLLKRVTKNNKNQPPFPIGQAKRYLKQLFLGLALLHSPKLNILHRDIKTANLLINNRGKLQIADFGLARHALPLCQNYDGQENIRDNAQGRKNPRMTNLVVTLPYRPPELLLGADHYEKAVDMWSAGCIMAEILHGDLLFFEQLPGPASNEQLAAKQMELICRVLGRPTKENMPSCTGLKFYDSLVRNDLRVANMSTANNLVPTLLKLHITDPLAIDLLQNLLTLDPQKRISAAEAAMHPWFDAEPRMFTYEEMPSYESSHEMPMKNMGRPRLPNGFGMMPPPSGHHHRGNHTSNSSGYRGRGAPRGRSHQRGRQRTGPAPRSSYRNDYNNSYSGPHRNQAGGNRPGTTHRPGITNANGREHGASHAPLTADLPCDLPFLPAPRAAPRVPRATPPEWMQDKR